MSQYIYAIIPYDSGMKLSDEEKEQGIYAPFFPELDSIDSEFTEESLYSMLEEYIQINTCYRQSAFTNNKGGYCWIRSEICQIAKALQRMHLALSGLRITHRIHTCFFLRKHRLSRRFPVSVCADIRFILYSLAGKPRLFNRSDQYDQARIKFVKASKAWA